MKFNPNNNNTLFVELLTSNYNRIRSFILTLVPNTSDADDILQETSKVIWEKFDQFEIGSNFASWAITIAKFQALNYIKKYNVKVQFSSQMIELLSEEAVQPLVKENERLHALRECLTKLKHDDQKLIRFRFVNKKTARELSKTIGVAMNTIYRNESRILSLLMKCVHRTLGVSDL